MVRFWICIFKVVKVGFPNGLDEGYERTGGVKKEQMVFGLNNWKYESSIN